MVFMKRTISILLVFALLLGNFLTFDLQLYAEPKARTLSENELDIIWLKDKYIEVGNFSEGLAAVKGGTKSYSWYVSGYINPEGQEVIELHFTNAYEFRNGIAKVDADGSADMMSHYQFIESFIDKNGNIISYKKTEHNPYPYGNIVANYDFEETNKKYNTPKIIEKEQYLLKPMNSGGKWGYADENNNLIVPYIFDEAHDFSEGVAIVKKDGRWGILKNPLENMPEPKKLDVAVSSEHMTIDEGKSQNVNASSSEGAVNFTYSSSDPYVASVDNQGNIKAKRSGTCVISVMASKDGFESVSKKIYVEVHGLKSINLIIEPSVLIMREGESKNFVSNINEAETLSADNHDKDIVDLKLHGGSGLLQAKKKGLGEIDFKASREGYKDAYANLSVLVLGNHYDALNVSRDLSAKWSTIKDEDKDTRVIRE